MVRNTIKISHAITAATVLLILVLAIYASTLLSTQDVLVDLVETWGYPTVVILGLISGLNAVLPIPAATLTPLFTAAGLTIPGIIFSLTLGTMLADYLGFLFGASTKSIVASRYPNLVTLLNQITKNHRRWLVLFVIFYAAFIPFPNEALLIPLAFSGVSFRRLLIPLIIGNTIHQLLLVYGVVGLASFFS